MNGIVLLNKPQGLTSNAALQKVKRALGAKKAGHTGSLDPLATGMLPICLGEATKFSQYLLDADKIYEATGKLGTTTTTGDAWGQALVVHDDVSIDLHTLKTVLARFRGEITQIPPMFSALKHQGVPLYKLARQGKSIERAGRQVTIQALDLLSFDGVNFSIRVRCTKGTYIRTLVEDIGVALGVGAHVTVLHRVATAGFDDDLMYTLDELHQAHILPLERAVVGLPVCSVTPVQKQALQHGQEVVLDSEPNFIDCRLLDDQGVFFGVGIWDGILRAKRLLANEKE